MDDVVFVEDCDLFAELLHDLELFFFGVGV